MSKQQAITILLVDDNDINRYTIGRMLRQAGYAIVGATTGAEAIEFAKGKPDLIVLDVNLPDIDGFEVCRQVKSNPATAYIPILQKSAAFTSSDDQVHGLEGGADGYLIEPFELSVLVATIRALLRINEAEEKARTLSRQWQATFDAISDGIWLLDPASRIVRCNGAMARFLGIDRNSVKGRLTSEFIDEPPLLASSPKTDDAETENELLFPDTKDLDSKREIKIGDHWLSVSSDYIDDDAGNRLGKVQVFHDVTERKKIEQVRLDILVREQEARRELETASRLKDEFLATLSHELRTPLTSMLGWLDLLRNKEVPQDKTETALEIVERNAQAQVKIINDLLDVSRAIAGKLHVDLGPIDLAQPVKSVVHSFSPEAEAKGIEVSVELGQSPWLVQGDTGRMEQIVGNLLSNAIKFTPAGGKIRVAIDDFHSHVRLRISDTGNGIEPEFLPFVFERFRQGDGTTTRRQGGLGLGLAIVQHFVGAQHGIIEAHSEGVGKGSTFTLSFPKISVPKNNADSSTPEANHSEFLQAAVVSGQSKSLEALQPLVKSS